MIDDRRAIVSAFDDRSARYGRNAWHRVYAEALVDLAPLRPGDRVLDAGAGTGFASRAIARRVAPDGHVIAVDVSRGMHEQLRAATAAAGLRSIDMLEADATALPFADASFDAVVCAAALLYMPVERALRAWHGLLRAGGWIGFSSMQAGSPPAGQLFRACAAKFGLILEDPSARLGSAERCREVLLGAGFSHVEVTPGTIDFSPADLEMAWESNLRSASHSSVRGLPAAALDAMQQHFEAECRRAQATTPNAFNRAAVLYAFGRK
jgi:ubiquinone/menaquinone biosynthesis C-methylase UbiE